MIPECRIATKQETIDPIVSPIPVPMGMPVRSSPTFEGAVRLFKQWGFQVEPGPRPEEVSLILEGPGFRSVSVFDAAMLPEIAATASFLRWQNRALSQCESGRNGSRGATSL